MIVWINGPFGAGKTTTARELIELIPNSTLFDPEVIGGALPYLLPPKHLAEVGDFQDLPIWRRLVIDTAAAMLAELGGTLVVPMTLLRQEYRDEIFGGLAARRIAVRHILLAPAETILRDRIAHREVPDVPDGELRTRTWAYDHIETYRSALAGWLTADAHPVDNGRLTPRQTAARIAETLASGALPVCDIVQTPEPTAETLAAGVLLFDEQDRVLL
ncbi:AAA family ATPase, partial [Streptomyces sp. NPDC003832]